ncbi:hypothetical protein PoB_000029100 [Plakobranchus ocellatus]|uniref:Uncharacterized protein n=1 Tax=Plakobranchus ocellatus TaxID=259542 RepID=A0AAV3XRP7_9GAST|nr:hypothetical protein PoB_000029100 [Plakobranchus ocellatus]
MLQVCQKRFAFFSKDSPQQSRLTGSSTGQGARGGARARDRGALQISGRIHFPLCHQYSQLHQKTGFRVTTFSESTFEEKRV